MRDGMNDFLRTAHGTDPTMPADVRALEDAVGVRLVVADRTDPDEVGFVQWRVAFYVAGLGSGKSTGRNRARVNRATGQPVQVSTGPRGATGRGSGQPTGQPNQTEQKENR